MNTHPFKTIKSTLTLVLGTISLATAQTGTLTNVSAANYRSIVAPNSIVAAWRSSLTSAAVVGDLTNTGSGMTLPAILNSVQLSVAMAAQPAVTSSLYLVSPGQINYVLPGDTALGAGSASASSDNDV